MAMHGGRADDFTIGWPELDQINQIDVLARKVGVSLPDVFYGWGGKRYTDEDLISVASLWGQPNET